MTVRRWEAESEIRCTCVRKREVLVEKTHSESTDVSNLYMAMLHFIFSASFHVHLPSRHFNYPPSVFSYYLMSPFKILTLPRWRPASSFHMCFFHYSVVSGSSEIINHRQLASIFSETMSDSYVSSSIQILIGFMFFRLSLRNLGSKTTMMSQEA